MEIHEVFSFVFTNDHEESVESVLDLVICDFVLGDDVRQVQRFLNQTNVCNCWPTVCKLGSLLKKIRRI